MHTLLIHPNFPSQFGHLALKLASMPGHKVTFLTSVVPQCGPLPFDVVTYRIGDRPVSQHADIGRTIEDHLLQAKCIFDVCESMPDLKPDVVLGHASFGPWLYLRALYRARFITYYEILPPEFWSPAFSLRPDFPPSPSARAFNGSYHAMAYLHLHACDAAYTPTYYQLSTCPRELRAKVNVIHDGIDTTEFRRLELPRPRHFRGIRIRPETEVITYLSRGLESFRGFDVFMKAMKIVLEQRPNAIAIVVGQRHTFYGHDMDHTGGLSFADWVLEQDEYPTDRIHFMGVIPPSQLAEFFSLSDCHVYLTVPWVLSWSLTQAMACEAPLVVSDTAPLREVVEPGMSGLMAPFYGVDDIVDAVLAMLESPTSARLLGEAARQTVVERYSLDVCLPSIVSLLRG